uniref:Dirigent protein n=1 Tax=Oryza brachyantha TaxID=4533 RepID=J3LPH4_ORYBR
MALNKNTTSTYTYALILQALLFSQLLQASEGRPFPDDGSFISVVPIRRYLLSHGNGAVPNGIMVEGAVSPSSEIHGDNGPMVGVDGVRPTNPGHSPGIGHAVVNKNGPAGKKL